MLKLLLDIGSCDGAEWREKRNFTLQALRTFGFGKESMENLIAEEVAILVDQLKSKVGGKINVHKLFFAGFLNVIWVTAAGESIDCNSILIRKSDNYFNSI